MTRVALIGGGPLPAQLGAEFALGGCSVVWAGDGSAGSGFEDALRLAAAHGLAGPAELERARALAGAEDGRVALILEAGEDRAAAKAATIAAVAARHPEALVATATLDGPLTALADAAGVGERMLAIGYGRPPLLQPVVELTAARDTPSRLLDRVSQLLRAIGKRPVALRREIAGTVSDRVELAIVRECLGLLERGVADAAEIDEVVRDGLARAWAAAGPLAHAALDGRERLLRAAGDDVEQSELGSLPDAAADVRRRRDDALAAGLRSERLRRPGAGGG